MKIVPNTPIYVLSQCKLYNQFEDIKLLLYFKTNPKMYLFKHLNRL